MLTERMEFVLEHLLVRVERWILSGAPWAIASLNRGDHVRLTGDYAVSDQIDRVDITILGLQPLLCDLLRVVSKLGVRSTRLARNEQRAPRSHSDSGQTFARSFAAQSR